MKKWLKIVIPLIIVLIIIIVIIAKPPLEKQMIKNKKVYFLLMGADSVEHVSRADTIMVVKLTSKGKLSILAIPRDTRVDYLGEKVKINTVFARGYVHGGFKSAASRVKNILENLININITRYAIIDYRSFKSLIDIVGGVNVYVSKDMYYLDKSGGLLIDIPKGVQRLDGKRSLEFIRFRNDGLGDLGRISREKDFLSSLIKKDNIEKFIRNPKVIRTVFKMVVNNFNIKELFYLKKFTKGLDLGNIKMGILKGAPKKIGKGYYYISNTFAYDDNFSKSKKSKKKLLVKILNGNGKKGIGEHIAEILRSMGYDVVTIENADNFNYEKSVLLNYTKEYENIKKIVDHFKVKIIYSKEKRGIYDIQFIIGKDLENY
ncbi:LCP family protein [bacterium]|nr:LCP family protein [bacterium]